MCLCRLLAWLQLLLIRTLLQIDAAFLLLLGLPLPHIPIIIFLDILDVELLGEGSESVRIVPEFDLGDHLQELILFLFVARSLRKLAIFLSRSSRQWISEVNVV